MRLVCPSLRTTADQLPPSAFEIVPDYLKDAAVEEGEVTEEPAGSDHRDLHSSPPKRISFVAMNPIFL